jgi:hypothetical protein
MSKIDRFTSRREFLRTSVAAAAGLGLLSSLGRGVNAQSPLVPFADLPNTHNMMVVGVKTVYLSHLPMFDDVNPEGTDFTSPHRRQVIMEATFSQAGKDITPVYLKDRLSHPQERMYTLKPAKFLLGQVDPNGMALRTFRGNAVFRGHLERDGRQRIIGRENAASFDVNVKKVVHFHKFDPKGTKPAHLEYLLFGKGAELFLAHFITLPDDFDQIVSVNIPGHGFTDAQLSQGMHVVFAGRGNTARERLKEKDKDAGEFQLPGGSPKSLPVEVAREFYFEETELLVTPNFDQSEEEKKSGFPEVFLV